MDLGLSVGRSSNWTVFEATLGMYDHDGICIAAHDRHGHGRSLAWCWSEGNLIVFLSLP